MLHKCEIGQKGFKNSLYLSRHNKTAVHLKKKEMQYTDIPITNASFVDCYESIKEEDIKEEIKEEESVEDPSSTSYLLKVI